MTLPTVGFLKQLLDTPGPSGFGQAPARLWRDEVATFADDVRADVHGNSVAAVNPKGKPRLMLAGHIDEIGLQVTHIDDDGYLYFAGIGGWDSQVLVGQRVLLLGRSGPVRGVIGKKAVHHLKKEELDKVSKVADLWIDIGAASKAEAGERVRVGDAGVLDTAVQEYPNGRIVSRSIDNRIGAYVVAEAVRRLAADRPKHAAVFAVATTREEIAWAGGGARTSAAGIDPQVALVVDVTHATDYPGAEKKHTGDHRLGGGAVLSRGASSRERISCLDNPGAWPGEPRGMAPGIATLLALQVGQRGLRGGAHLLVAVVGEALERADRRRGGGEAQRFDGGDAQRHG